MHPLVTVWAQGHGIKNRVITTSGKRHNVVGLQIRLAL